MKKVILLILILIFLTGCSGVYNLTIFVLPDDIEFLNLIKEMNTPEKISDYMLRNFVYEAHAFYAPDPYTIWKIGKVDCNDMSTFGRFVANYHGIETWEIVISYEDTIFKHYIAVYREYYYYSITNLQYYFSTFDSFREIVEHNEKLMSGMWLNYIVYDYDKDIVETGYNY